MVEFICLVCLKEYEDREMFLDHKEKDCDPYDGYGEDDPASSPGKQRNT